MTLQSWRGKCLSLQRRKQTSYLFPSLEETTRTLEFGLPTRTSEFGPTRTLEFGQDFGIRTLEFQSPGSKTNSEGTLRLRAQVAPPRRKEWKKYSANWTVVKRGKNSHKRLRTTWLKRDVLPGETRWKTQLEVGAKKGKSFEIPSACNWLI